MEKWDNDQGLLAEEMAIIVPKSQHFPLLLLHLCLPQPRTQKFKYTGTAPHKPLHAFFFPAIIFKATLALNDQ